MGSWELWYWSCIWELFPDTLPEPSSFGPMLSDLVEVETFGPCTFFEDWQSFPLFGWTLILELSLPDGLTTYLRYLCANYSTTHLP